MAEPRPVRSLEQIHALILAEIVGGAYRPGDRIAIKALSDRLGLSTTPLRETLSRLAGRGVVEQRRSEGYYLSRLDARDIAQLFSLHEMCVARAVSALTALPTIEATDVFDAWSVFDALGQHADDAIVRDVRRYLDDRLKPLRRLEADAIPDQETELARLMAACATDRRDAMTHEIAVFHQRRRDLAHHFALELGRTRR
ncbi:GntR family transcriptional regulator [Sphingomonas sp. AP4-R1]|uniref:GntR family transcriptional regulator n=1 Tax=Sphingomonas sp. AP4-R1 TaxID=2735134 RepID=UPI00149338E1|nr:GntR family transcriptional regulator [Sphingomonas sp. AP4-R1]QJU60079.1 GntR family transcriptional regulator [Sphingomonas sp. AP4-R1]